MSWNEVETALTAHQQIRTSLWVADASVPGETSSPWRQRRGIILAAWPLQCK